MLWLLLTPFALWLLYCLAWLVIMVFTPRPDVPCFDGIAIHIPAHYRERMTSEEFLAMFAHEVGHRHLRHVWKNFALICTFRRPSVRKRINDELEADDYAAGLIGAAPLASGLRKFSGAPFDDWRAERLETMCLKSGDPNARDARVPKEKTACCEQ